MQTLINCAHTAFLRNKDRTERQIVKGSRGFSLLEILVAVFILGIVVSLVLGSFGALFGDADRINIGTDLHEMGNACLSRITSDLKSIHVASYPRYKPPSTNADPEMYHIKGETTDVGDEFMGWLRFTSTAHLPFNSTMGKGIAEIVYYAHQTEDDDIVLRRADNLYPYPEEFEEKETDPVMCEQVRKFELTYFDIEGEEFDRWDSETRDVEYSTPRAIAVKLVLGTEDLNFNFSTRITLPAYRYKKVKK